MTCFSALVFYNISKGFVISETKEIGLDKIKINFQKKINAVSKHDEDSVLTFKTAITLIVNTLNKISIPRNFYESYAAKFYDYRHIETLKL